MKYVEYSANPRQPDAIESGALKINCQMKRNDIIFPSLPRP